MVTNITDEQMEQLFLESKMIRKAQSFAEDTTHPVDDVNLLEDWMLGDLSDEEIDRLNAHFSRCFYCRSELNELRQLDDMTFPGYTADFTVVETMPPRKIDAIPSWKRFSVFQIAASLLLVCAVGLFATLSLKPREMANRDLHLANPLLTDYGYDRSGNPVGIKNVVEPQDAEEQRLLTGLAETPDKVELRFNYGQWLLAQSRLSDAIAQFELVAERRADSPDVLNALGMAWFMKESHLEQPPTEARKCFDRALRLAPDDREIHFNMAVCLNALGERKLAEKHFEKAKK